MVEGVGVAIVAVMAIEMKAEEQVGRVMAEVDRVMVEEGGAAGEIGGEEGELGGE